MTDQQNDCATIDVILDQKESISEQIERMIRFNAMTYWQRHLSYFYDNRPEYKSRQEKEDCDFIFQQTVLPHKLIYEFYIKKDRNVIDSIIYLQDRWPCYKERSVSKE